MTIILGLAIIFCQVAGAVIMFGGRPKCPKWMRVAIGIGLIFMLLAIIGLSSEY